MEQTNGTGQTVRFGAFDVDPRSGELRKAGTRIRLQAQPFKVLLALLERPGELVSRDELRRRIWPEESFGDFDHAVSVAILKLRTALGDTAEIPRYVETLHRRGYRFIFPMSAAIPQEADDHSRPTLGQYPQKQTIGNTAFFRGNRYVVLFVCFGLLAAIVTASGFWLRSTNPNGPAKIAQISRWNKPIGSARLSPDGHAIAFSSLAGGINQIFLILTSGGETLQLTNDEGDKFVNNFSADGKEVYYTRRNEVWAVHTLGGSPSLVASVASADYILPSPDGTSFFYTKPDSPGIFRMGKSGLNEELVYKSHDRFLFPMLVFPGGNDLLAGASRLTSSTGTFFRINLTNHEAVDLGDIPGSTDVAWGDTDTVWAEAGNSILFSHEVDGVANIWKYSFRNGSLTQITFGTGSDSTPMPDPGGKGIYYINKRRLDSLTAYYVRSKQSIDIVPEGAGQPIISRDAKRVMYITYPGSGKAELWMSDTNGGNKVKITAGGTQDEELETLNWAPDSFHVFFSRGSKLYIVGADGSGLRQLLPMKGATIVGAVSSPDQKSVYLSTLDSAENTQEGAEFTHTVWKWNEGSKPEKLVEKCGFAYDIDPGGKYLLAVGKGGINELSISDRKCISLFRGAKNIPIFASDGKSLLYPVAARREVDIYRQPWKDGHRIGTSQVALKLPFSFPLSWGVSYDFSRDLSTILYMRPVYDHADIYFLSQK
jgi:DNA-binding winged helix-turn-helix (wHTH) protein/Tol biopolymer transport system component